ncbi:MAG: hypothetical protein Q8N79_05165 [Candidatus Methanoperedens sp.]|nr:hypothetical protein [Candidatus Methanoperedens sp.]
MFSIIDDISLYHSSLLLMGEPLSPWLWHVGAGKLRIKKGCSGSNNPVLDAMLLIV